MEPMNDETVAGLEAPVEGVDAPAPSDPAVVETAPDGGATTEAPPTDSGAQPAVEVVMDESVPSATAAVAGAANPEVPVADEVPLTADREVDHVAFVKAADDEEYTDYQTRALAANVSPLSVQVWVELAKPAPITRRYCGNCGAEIPGG